MPAPLSRQVFPIMTPEAQVERYIDNHYHLEMVTENSRQLVEYQSQSLRLQQDAAITNIRGMAEIAHRQDQSSALHFQTNDLLSTLVGGMDRLNDGIDELNATASETLNAVYAQSELLQEGFENIAHHMIEQRKVLEEIAYTLRRPYETKSLELLKEADCALKNGMKATGRDQKEEFKDASRLLRDILDNPIGSRNYVAWFQTGWLLWKHKQNIAEAEEAFYQASRLSSSQADLYHSFSLRHLAYMQYLQGKHEAAYTNIHKALSVTLDDHEVLYDAARYAAKTGRETESLKLLDRCIDLQPQTIITMFSEKDFMS